MTSKRLLLLVLPVVLILAAICYFFFTLWAGERLVTAIEEIDGIEHASCRRLRINPFTLDAALEDVVLQLAGGRGTLSAAGMRISDLTAGDTFPYGLDIEIQDLSTRQATLPFLSGPAWKPIRARLVNAARLQLAYRYTPEEKTLRISEVTIGVPGGGRITIAGELSNLYLERLLNENDNPLVAALTAAAISISRLEIDYSDEGLVKKLVADRALQAGMTVPDYAEKMGAWLQEKIQTGESARLDRSVAAVVRFIENPARIRMTARSDPPIPIGQFWLSRTRAPFFEKLALEVETLPLRHGNPSG